MKAIANVSRRQFVKGIFSTGALVLSASLVPEILRAQTTSTGASVNDAVLWPSVFVAIQSDDTISIVAARSEMGTGISTALPLVVADELDADWTKVKIKQADGDKRGLAKTEYSDDSDERSYPFVTVLDRVDLGEQLVRVTMKVVQLLARALVVRQFESDSVFDEAHGITSVAFFGLPPLTHSSRSSFVYRGIDAA